MALWHVCREEFFSGYAEFSVRIMDENAGDIRSKTKGEIEGQSRV